MLSEIRGSWEVQVQIVDRGVTGSDIGYRREREMRVESISRDGIIRIDI